MTWTWPPPLHLGYPGQTFSPHPHVQNAQPPFIPPPAPMGFPPPPPAPMGLPPPPPIAQLHPPVNYYSAPHIPTASPPFGQFPPPSQQISLGRLADVNASFIPPHHRTAPEPHSVRFQQEHQRQRRWNRHHSARLQDRRFRSGKPPPSRNVPGVATPQQRNEKHQLQTEDNSTKEVLSRLNTKLPGSSPADVEAWVAARKANWPSKTNTDRKEAVALKRRKAGAIDSASNKPSNVRYGTDCTQRDLATSRNVLSRLHTKLPGSSPEEIETWVKARKANWPSRANVERKLAAEKEKNNRKESISKQSNAFSEAMTKLADYSSSEEDGEHVNSKQKKASQRGKRSRKRQGGRGKDGQSRRRLEAKNSERKPTLLRMLLEREIRQEQSVLLQAFRYIITKKANETS